VHEAALLLPGFLCCFNIADFKRRNGHLGHLVGDADIAELDGLIAAMAGADGTAQRIGDDRWLMLSRSRANDRVQAVLDRIGWRSNSSPAGVSGLAGPTRSGSPRRGLRL
jgi:GGDEF domain-containing protein